MICEKPKKIEGKRCIRNKERRIVNMVTIDLITGFLGSGKTTFIKKYAEYLISQGLNIGILENDYGAVNVDMMLLQELEGEKCELEMIAGGCDKETHRRRFRTKLIAMGMCGYDRILVEPSGIYDVDEFFDVLRDEPLDKWYQIGSVITVVNAKSEKNLSEEARYLLASEAAHAGKIILSRSEEATKEEINTTIATLNQSLKEIQCNRILGDEMLMRRDGSELSEDDFSEIAEAGYVQESYEKRDVSQESGFESLYFMDVKLDAETLKTQVKKILEDAFCGKVFRIKGFSQNQDGSWIELNATQDELCISPIPQGQEIQIVIGEHLNEEKIRSYWEV